MNHVVLGAELSTSARYLPDISGFFQWMPLAPWVPQYRMLFPFSPSSLLLPPLTLSSCIFLSSNKFSLLGVMIAESLIWKPFVSNTNPIIRLWENMK